MPITPSQQNNNFLNLSDTPNSYSGQGGKLVAVNDTANALAFGAVPTAAYTMDNPPVNPSIYDDEFDGTTLNTTKWSWLLAGAPSSGVESYGVSKGKIWATVGWDSYYSANWTEMHSLSQSAPNTSFTIFAKVNMYQAIGGFYGIFMADRLNTPIHRGFCLGIGNYDYIQQVSCASFSRTADGSIGSLSSGSFVAGNGCYLKMVWNNSTKIMYNYVSPDGYSWWTQPFYNSAWSITPSVFGLFWWAYCSTSKTPHIDRGGASFDFFRVTLP